MSSIKKVGIIGASGNLGQPLVAELVAGGFTVVALTRETSTATFPSGVHVQKVDYASPELLREAFVGLDALVSTIATAATGEQTLIVDAALAAGVKRIIPAEFGISTRTNGDLAIGKMLAGKTALVDYLMEKSKANPAFSWTGICTGMFFDWGLRSGMLGYDLDKKEVTLVDSGNEKYQTSTLAQVARSIAGVLKKPEATANQYIYVNSFNASQNEILAALEDATGSKWTVTKVNSSDLVKEGEEKLAKGDYTSFVPLVRAYNSADGAKHALALENSANALVGIQEEDLKDAVRHVVQGA